MADIDQILAGGTGASTRADFSGIPKLLDSYWAGQDQYAKNQLRDAFKPTAQNPNGIPLDANGQPDIPAIAKTLFQKGDIAGGVGLLGTIAAQQDRRDYVSGGSGQPVAKAPQQPIISPSANRSASVVDGQPRTVQGGEGSQGGGRPRTTIMQVAAAQSIPNDQLQGVTTSIARQLGPERVGPNGEIDLNDPQVTGILVPAIAQFKRAGIGQVQPPQPGDQQPGSIAPMVPTPVQTQNIQPQAPQGFQPSPDQLAAQNDPVLKRLRFNASSPNKDIAAAGKAELEAYLESKKLTNEEKLARASGMTIPQYQERTGELAAQQAGATENAKADVTEQRAYIDNGKMAGTRLGTLNAIQNIINTDKKLNLGFGAETTLKIKMALEQAGFDFGDLSGPQLIQKFGAALASESTKALATRPTQFEFKTFLANNPGLLLDEKGNIRMIGIMAQNAKREYDLGVLARRNKDNWDKWDDVVEAYDKKFPIKDPTTGRILSNSSIIAPGPSKQQQAAPALEPGKTMMNGYLFKGGNPKDKANWELRS